MCYNACMEKSVRIWAKLISDGKVAKDVVYTGAMFYDEYSFHAAVRDICDKLDVATPVVLPQHFANFMRFHNCRFYEWDFVETFGYDKFILEDCN